MASRCFLGFSILVHILMLLSLFSEPFELKHGQHLDGTVSHPVEQSDYRGFLDAWFHDTDRVPRGLDFFSIYQAGRNFLRGQSVYYGVRVHRLGNDALVVPYFSGFRYLPVYACTYGVALNLLPPWPAYWTWIIMIEILLLLNLWIIRKLPVSLSCRQILTGMWLAYTPTYIELHIGQQSFVTVTLLHCALLSAITGKLKRRDLCYSASVIWKLNTILFIPIWVKFKRFGTIALLFLAVILLSAPYFLWVPGSFPEFTSYFHHKFIATGPNSLGFWSLAAVILNRCGVAQESIRNSLQYWTMGLWTLASLATLVPRRIPFTRALAMWICVYFLTYQYVWEHHYVMMLPVFSAGMIHPRLRRLCVAVWLLCALPTPYILWNVPSQAMPQLQWTFSQEILYHSTKLIPVLILFLALVFQLFRKPARDSSPQESAEPESQLDVIALLSSRLRKDRRAV
ncbi:MAG TPA: hypothetical protein PLV45_06165 [bacterium]|nr:hypothetical protein [bacterium]